METLILSLLFKIGPYVIAVLGVVAVYLGIKRRGAAEERAKWEQEVADEKDRVRREVEEAVRQDAAIDNKVRGEIDAIKTPSAKPDDPDIFRF
jgi:hypothetical protein